MSFKDKDFTENDIYAKLLNDKLQTNLGYLYENIIAQTLATNGHGLFYHTFRNEAAKRNYEIDFLTTFNKKICPIEVKSSGYKNHSSIDKFSEKFSSRISRKILAYTKDVQKDGNVELLPVYMIQFL